MILIKQGPKDRHLGRGKMMGMGHKDTDQGRGQIIWFHRGNMM